MSSSDFAGVDDDTVRTGAMVAFGFDREVADLIAVPNGETPDRLHVTLAYLGDAVDVDRAAVEQVCASLADFEAIPVCFTHQAWLGDADVRDAGEVAVVFEPSDAGDLHTYRTLLVEALTELGVSWSNRFPFRPHVTRGYFPVDQAAAEFPEGPIDGPVDAVLSTLEFHYAGEITRWDLAFPAPDPSDNPPETPMTDHQHTTNTTASGVIFNGDPNRIIVSAGTGAYTITAPRPMQVVPVDELLARLTDPKFLQREAVPVDAESDEPCDECDALAAAEDDDEDDDGDEVVEEEVVEEDALVAGASASDREVPWVAALCKEGVWTGDGRFIEPGALEFESQFSPWTFMVMTRNPDGGGGHDAALVGGRIDQIWRVDNGDDTATVWGSGVFDRDLDGGQSGIRMWQTRSARGVSVDLDNMEIAADEIDIEQSLFGPSKIRVKKARIRGATMCNFAAFIEARIVFAGDGMPSAATVEMPMEDGEAPEGGYALVASMNVVAAGRLATDLMRNPPLDLFKKRSYDRYTPLTITKDGVVSGHVIRRGQCHIGFGKERCVELPQSSCAYRYARAGGHVLTVEGEMVPTARLFAQFKPGLRAHAPEDLPAAEAVLWYENMTLAVGDVVPFDDEFGIQLQGRLRPGALTGDQVIALQGSDWSPDWRWMHETRQRECLVFAAVNTSGGPSTYDDLLSVDRELGLVASAGGPDDRPIVGTAYIAGGEVMTLIASAGQSSRRRTARLAREIVELEERIAGVEDRNESLAGTVEQLQGQIGELVGRFDELAGLVEPAALASVVDDLISVLPARG